MGHGRAMVLRLRVVPASALMARPELARRQRERAEALAATDPRLDFTVESIAVLAGDESDDGLAYVGEVLLRAAGAGEWDRLDGAPAITLAGATVGMRGLDAQRVREILEVGVTPTPPAPSRSVLLALPLLLLYAATMVALLWWFAGRRLALYGAIG